MAKPWRGEGFKELLEEWNQKLKESGFKDIEQIVYGELVLKESGTVRRYQKLDHITRELKAEYFRKVSHYVAHAQFKNDFEKEILNLYSQGMSQAAIYRVLKVKGHRCKVYYPLYRYLKLWGLKK